MAVGWHRCWCRFCCTIYSFRFTFAAYDLVVKFDVDIRIFVPAYFRESKAVELLKTFHLIVEELSDGLFAFLAVDVIGHFAEFYNVVAYSRYYLHALDGQYVDLFYLILPQVVLHDCLAQWRQACGGIASAYASGGDDEIACVVAARHDAVVVVDIVVIAVVGFDAYDGHTLCD